MRTLLLMALLVQFNFGFSQSKFDVSAVTKFQQEINAEYANPKTSPLNPEDLAAFKSLDFYPANEKFFVVAQFVRTKKEKPFVMKTSGVKTPLYVKYGEAHFELDGKKNKLNIYKNIELSKKKEYKDYLLVPFSDLTTGEESYIGGKYLDLKIPKGKTVVLDFNVSYNPYCAYSHRYSCPLVPLENDLDVEIRAGVKKFHD